MAAQGGYVVPRSFKLRMELDVAEKGDAHDERKDDPNAPFISLGLGQLDDGAAYDYQLANWTSSIIGPQNTNLGERIYTLRLTCGPRYPSQPPTIQFQQKINMPGVDKRGFVQLPGPVMPKWDPSAGMYGCLRSIRVAMKPAAKLKQPAEHETYW
mmetsp:Transcript_7505/g.8523  ORF Transcript_7505/g.8523 Transcript_7505/m.8523 type:complete len:155 (+) Transcript_7505:25-489(+)|eukprot:CAMPEP_0205822460 /NCGR_PEP_ID=MMETSP0206-20130828/12583_1 /ASSEMBLY_ACC=CAM_ASM_000279 /TAXON_ID=36767 /ORGANISM="Euplotes focardii, Strain TN1" /LENGTH=154 /DNA_ID=CAMNT_0053118749 /DNA_START=25 /DNA_END=489 /DNA_ORIENTATION=+